MRGSLTGAVTSQIVTEVYKGNFKQNFIVYECNGKNCLTVRYTYQTEMKVGHSDPVVLCGKAIAQRIKGTPGITG